MKTEQKITKMREIREEACEQLMSAIYERRGWTNEGIPRVETLRRLGLDDPEMFSLAEKDH